MCSLPKNTCAEKHSCWPTVERKQQDLYHTLEHFGKHRILPNYVLIKHPVILRDLFVKLIPESQLELIAQKQY